jgi:hypothetical protein
MQIPLPRRQADPVATGIERTAIMLKLALPIACLLVASPIARPAVAAPDQPVAASVSAPLDADTLSHVKDLFRELMDHANKHDVDAIRGMFWDSPSALIVAKSADPAEGNWAGFWGIDAVTQKIHDIAASGPVQLFPDYSRLKAVGISTSVAETYIPMNIAVSYAGQDPAPHPFLMIVDWLNTASGWKIASEIIIPVPPAPAPASAGKG